MLVQEKQIRLKNGVTAIFRSPRLEDSKELIEYLKTTAGQTPFLLRDPEECTTTEEQEIAWIKSEPLGLML